MPLTLLTAGTRTKAADGADPARTSGVRPAVKKELPWLNVPEGRMKTTLFYGPWQCRQTFVNQCQSECFREGFKLMGCMWLADIKLEWEGRLGVLPVPVKAGSRYGVYHCCCNYPTLPKDKKEAERRKWDNIREAFREKWGQRFGPWPEDGDESWPGHHIRDLWHGGDPVDPNNLLPARPDVHDVFTRSYPGCSAGLPPWNAAGPDLPYTDG